MGIEDRSGDAATLAGLAGEYPQLVIQPIGAPRRRIGSADRRSAGVDALNGGAKLLHRRARSSPSRLRHGARHAGRRLRWRLRRCEARLIHDEAVDHAALPQRPQSRRANIVGERRRRGPDRKRVEPVRPDIGHAVEGEQDLEQVPQLDPQRHVLRRERLGERGALERG
ncbi:MAG: hypothetical protein K8M05_07920 [Deltaproteobacteria bacterium]|nr:hypothetical protein [Kofleriaceae bacterium]